MVAFNFNEKNSFSDYGIYIKSIPNIPSPKKKTTSISIPGRNSKIVFDEDAYEDIKISVECFIKGENLIDRIDRIKAWLLKERSGLNFSFQEDKKYKGEVINDIDFEVKYRKMAKFKIEFECEPFKYKNVEEVIEVKTTKTILNLGTYYAEPTLNVECIGNGEININGKIIKLKAIEKRIIINSSIQNAYSLSNENLNNKMEGEFPKFIVGDNNISFSGGISKITIEPNWRWI